MTGDRDRGAITLLAATFAVIVLASVLALFDGARRLQAIASAQDLASETARYAAAIIEQSSLIASQPVIDAEAAVADAEAFALAAGASEAEVVVAANGLSVVATIVIDGGTAFTPGFDLSARAQHRAFALVSDPPSP